MHGLLLARPSLLHAETDYRRRTRNTGARKSGAIANAMPQSVEALRPEGWGELIVWECELKDLFRLAERVSAFLGA